MIAEYKRTGYPSDLTDEQWEKIAIFFPSGNKSKHHKRNLVEAVMYAKKQDAGGGHYRMIIRHTPPYTII